MATSTRHYAEQRFGLKTGQYPFESRFVHVGGTVLHYVDEGRGPILLMLHGNPAWSFIYRHAILALKDRYRCVAIDLPGFGLSEAGGVYGYRPEDHSAAVGEALAILGIREATLIANDWGGPIGLGAMLRSSGRITRLILGNTWAWPVNGDLHYEAFSRIMGGPLGRWGGKHFAVFVNGFMPMAMKRRTLSEDEMRAYRAPFGGKSRLPMHVLAASILGSRPWLKEIEAGMRGFRGPVHFVWPEKDIAFREKELRRWLALLPQATLTRLPNCGHFPWEDAPEEAIAAIEAALAGQPVPA